MKMICSHKWIENADLGGPEAEGSGLGVGLLSVLQDQSTVISQGQIVTSREMA